MEDRDPAEKPQLLLNESFKQIKDQIGRLESRLTPILISQSPEKKATETCKTELLQQLDGVHKRLCELNSRIRL